MKEILGLKCLRSLFVPALMLVSFAACQKGGPLTTADTYESDASNKKKPTGLTAEAIGLTNPNQYQIHLKWLGVMSPNHSWIIRRTEEKEGMLLLTTPTPQQNNYSDTKVTAGLKYKYQMGYVQEGKFIERATTEIEVPLDFELSRAQQLATLTKYRRIFLHKEGVIFSGGGPLTIEADELYSDGGKITVYPEESVAGEGQDGKNAEPIIIKIRHAQGALTLESNGQKGGNGPQGATGNQGNPGAIGKAWGLDLVNANSNPIQINLRANNVVPTDPQWQLVFKCTNPGQSDGEAGGPGYPGAQGIRGGKGGDTSKIYLKIDEASQLNLTLNTTPGKGGNGGMGGNGGPGGVGGLGNWDPHHICPQPKNGPQGAQGPVGPNGPEGASGNIQSVCKKLNGTTEGDCTPFENTTR